MSSLIFVAYRWNAFERFDSSSGQSVLFARGFESGALDGLETSGDGAFSIDSSRSRTGKQSIKLSVTRSGKGQDYRAEVVPVEVKNHHRGTYARIGRSYWYGFSLFLPEDWEVAAEPESVCQWHGVPDRLLLEGYRNPALALKVVGDTFVLERRHDSALVTTFRREAGPSDYDSFSEIKLGSIDSDLGQWTDWAFQVKWAYEEGEGGTVQVWKNGEAVAVLEGPNCFNDLRGGPYLKIGPYRWTWKQERGSLRAREFWVDDIRIANQGDRLSDVMPPLTRVVRAN